MLAPFNSSPPISDHTVKSLRSQQDQPSEVRQKISNYRTEIRNQEIREFKSKIRQEIVKVNCIEEMLERMPFDHDYSIDWASNLIRLYREAINFRLSAVQTVELFRLIQKFPNKVTFKLLQIVIFKADLISIDQIFQYDIMKLLHSSITSCQRHYQSNSQSSEQNDRIIRQAVIYNTTQQQFSNLKHCSSDHQKLQFIQVTIRIIGELCRKKVHIRNFAVINHKTFTYCLKAYKEFGFDIKLQFYELLYAFTYFSLQRNEEQFSRITNKILIEVFRQRWQIDPSCEDREIKALSWLLKATYNLLKNKCGWINFKLQLMEKKENRLLINIFKAIIKRFNYIILNNKEKISPLLCKLIVAAIECTMIYDQGMGGVYQSKGNQSYLSERVDLLSELVLMLRQSKYIPLLQQVRPGLYFMLNNYCYEQWMNRDLKYCLMNPKNQPDLLSFLSSLLFAESREQNIYELSYLIHTIFQEMPLEIIEPLLLPSEILQSLCFKITDHSYQEHNFASFKSIIVKAIITIIHRLDNQLYTKFISKACKSMVYHQFKNQLSNMLSSDRLDDNLCRSIEQLVYITKQESDGRE